jgi:hypothetical protein
MLATYFSALTFFLWFAWHPFYISLTDMVYNPESERIEIAQKIFWDDLEVALANKYQKPIDFLNPKQPERLEEILENYLLEKNKINMHGKPLSLSYLGYEIEEDAAWFYLESEQVELAKEIFITNGLLIDEFPSQQNIVNFYINKKPKSLITHKDKTEGVLRF